METGVYILGAAVYGNNMELFFFSVNELYIEARDEITKLNHQT